MINKFEEFVKLFKEIDLLLNQKINVYLIGGAVMLYHGLKVATKDIDIVVDSKKEFNEFQNVLKKLNFELKIPPKEYSNFDLNQIFIKDEFRIDLFEKTVCKGFSLSKNMKKRAENILSLKNISVFLCSTTDIFMFKTFTERDGDIDDCLALAQKEILWDDLIKEVEYQIKLSNQRVWITYIAQRLEILEEKNLFIPIMKKIYKLVDEFYNDLETKLKK